MEEQLARLRAALDAAGDAVLIIDGDGRIVECNLATARLNGYDREAVMGLRLLDIAIENEATEEELDAIRSAMDGEDVVYMAERRNRRGDPVAIAVRATQLDGGNIAFVTRGLETHRQERVRATQARLLARVAETLSAPLGLDETLAALTRVLVPEAADSMLVALADSDGKLQIAVIDAADRTQETSAVEMMPSRIGEALPGSLLEVIVRGGQPVLVRDAQDPALPTTTRERLASLDVGAIILVPLAAHGEMVGVLVVAVAVASGRRFDDRDLSFFAEIGDRAALAILAARLEEARRKAEARFRGAFDHAPIGITITQLDSDGVARFIEVNAAMAGICGCSPDEFLRRPIADFTHPEDRADEQHRMQALHDGTVDQTAAEKRLVRPDGEIRWVHISGAPLGDGTYVAQVVDITERKRAESELEHLANHDPLTGVLNRRSFEAALELALANVRRHEDEAAIITLDVDNFKHVNDTYGHAAGDEVLRAAAHALRHRLRATDQIGRLGGDEFGVILSRADAAAARRVANELLEALRDLRVPVGERSVRVTVSAGLRMLEADEPVTDPGALLSEADMAMYDAKERGRDRLIVVQPGDLQPARIRARIRWSERIRDALENDGFVLYEQPILRLADSVIDRSELLIRLVEGGRDSGQVIAPAGFLGVAERFGQIQAIDRWVVRNAVALMAARQAAGDRRRVEVNLSGDSISDPSVIDFIVAEVQAAPIDPAALIFEVTETSTIGNLAQARDLAERLTSLGCGFALDDFGAGFGSFAYLKHLPLGVIKIDGQFVRGMRESHADQVTVRAIVDVARGLGKETVAEFVEDGETLELLRELGVDHAQGYYIGRPVPIRAPAHR